MATFPGYALTGSAGGAGLLVPRSSSPYVRGKLADDTGIEVLFIDLDGTALTDGHVLPRETLGSIAKAKSEGVYAVLTSGRAPGAIMPFAREIGIQSPLYIAHHGARIERDSQILSDEWVTPIDESSAVVAMNAVKSLSTELGLEGKLNLLYFRGNTVMHRSSQLMEEYQRRNPRLEYVHEPIDAGLSFYTVHGPADKLVVLADTPDTANILKRKLEGRISGENLQLVLSNDHYIEALNRDANKGTAAVKVLRYLRRTSTEAIAFGDGASDLTIPRYAQVPLYLVANASDSVKREARQMNNVTLLSDTNQNDAVGKAIEQMVLKQSRLQ